MMFRRLAFLVTILVLSAACSSVADSTQGNDDTATSRPEALALPGQPSCHLNGTSPDPGCTPGTMNTDVRENNLDLTVCVSGWATHQRHKLKDSTKRAVYDAYGVPHADRGTKFVLDHLVPIEAGGAVNAATNLWPQLKDESKRKDVAEKRAHKDLCSGHTTLQKVLEGFRGGQW
jgi:hypothetical protein